MSDIFTSPSGVHEHHTNISSGLVNKDKSTYTKNNKRTFKIKQLKKSYVEQENSITNSDELKAVLERGRNREIRPLKVTQNSGDFVPNTTNFSQQSKKNDKAIQSSSERLKSNVTVVDNTNQKIYLPKGPKGQKRNLSKPKGKLLADTKKVIRATTATVAVGTDFLASSESYQKDKDTGESSVEFIERGTKTVANNLETLAVKSNKSRYFKVANKASDSVKSSKNPGRFVKSVSSSKKAFAKGVNAVDSVIINPLVRMAGDDIGGQAAVKTVEVSRYSVQAAKTIANTTKTAVKTTGKAVRYTAQTTKKTVNSAQKAAKAASKAAQTTARATASAAKSVAAFVSKIIALIVANPVVALIVAAILLLLILIVMLCSSIMATGEVSSYGGTGNDEATVSLNDYSAVYDYANKAIATRCRDLFNIHSTATGYLRYNYNYEIENEDGSISTTSDYPIADIAPIMAYLAVNHQNYTLTDSIKAEIDNLVANLYTYTWRVDPYSYTIDHGSGEIETITGSQLTLIIRYHNSARYFEQNNILPQEKMAVYNSIKSYGDMSYFRMYNILKNENWHEWISSQYGYGLEGTLVHQQYADIIEYSLVQQDYISLSYKNSNNETIDKIYSPVNGKVTSIIEDENYDVILTIKDDENNLEFTVMSEFASQFSPTVSVGSVVTAGQLIANNSYNLDFKCKANGADINPLLIMEYYQHGS